MGLLTFLSLPKTKESTPHNAIPEIERRLSSIETKLNHLLVNNVSSPPNDLVKNGRLSPYAEGIVPDGITGPALSSSSPYGQMPVNSPMVGPGFRQTQSEAFAARPNLLTFCCPPFINSESWDDTELFYDDEIAAGEMLYCQCQAFLTVTPNIQKAATRHLQQSFVLNFLRWIPIFDLKTCTDHVAQAFANDFSPGPSSCLTLLLFAIGSISEDRNQSAGNDLPGLDFFALGSQMLEGLSLRGGSLTSLQCRVLHSVYLQCAIRPLQAWNSIVQASRDCMHIMSSSLRQRLDGAGRDTLHRVFWACSIILQ